MEQKKINASLATIQDRILKMFCNDSKSNPILKNIFRGDITKLGLRSMHSSNNNIRTIIFESFKTMSELYKKK